MTGQSPSPEQHIETPLPPDKLPDLRQQVPDLAPYLLKGERVIAVQNIPGSAPRRTPSSLYEMYRLVGATADESIGDAGPAMAGIPLGADTSPEEFRLYQTLFGRDSLRVAADLLPYYPKLARATLIKLAELQGVTTNAAREEEPGRIIHEARDPATDPIARKLTRERGWGWPYYGSVDATVSFVRTAAAYWRQPEPGIDLLDETYIGRDGAKHSMSDSIKAAVEWTTRRMDANPEGLVEYQSPLPKGIENEVWKDSWDAYFHADGAIANHQHGIASIEVQSQSLDALLDAANIYEHSLNRPETAAELRERAARLCAVILDRFWVDEQGGFFAIGTDRDKAGNLRPMRIRTSNMGHVLNSHLLEGSEPEIVAKREALIANLFSSEMLNVGGVRTLATNEVRFRPGAYHNGSVWLWDSYYIAQGLRLHGYTNLAMILEQRIVNATNKTKEFPEYIRGDTGNEPSLNTRVIDLWDSKYHKVNRVEQPPQQVQAWSVAATLAIQENHDMTPQTAAQPRPSAFEQRIIDSL